MRVVKEFDIVGDDFARAGEVSTEIKAMLKRNGYATDVVRRLAIAVYEAEMNVVLYAHYGRLVLEMDPAEIHVVLDDVGPGIADTELAMQEGYSTASAKARERGFGAGMGLPNIRRNADLFEIDSRVGEGTRLDFVVFTQGGWRAKA